MIWSLTSRRARRTSGPENFQSSRKRTFSTQSGQNGHATTAVRGRLWTTKRTLAFWYPCHAHAFRNSVFRGGKCGIVGHRIGKETAASEVWIECKTVPYGRSSLFQF